MNDGYQRTSSAPNRGAPGSHPQSPPDRPPHPLPEHLPAGVPRGWSDSPGLVPSLETACSPGANLISSAVRMRAISVDVKWTVMSSLEMGMFIRTRRWEQGVRSGPGLPGSPHHRTTWSLRALEAGPCPCPSEVGWMGVLPAFAFTPGSPPSSELRILLAAEKVQVQLKTVA